MPQITVRHLFDVVDYIAVIDSTEQLYRHEASDNDEIIIENSEGIVDTWGANTQVHLNYDEDLRPIVEINGNFYIPMQDGCFIEHEYLLQGYDEE